jgi:hypothetical protein
MVNVWYWVVHKDNSINAVVRSQGTLESATSCWLLSWSKKNSRFEWGSPALDLVDLAYAILMDTSGNFDLSYQLKEEFAEAILKQFAPEGFHLDGRTVKAWLTVMAGQQVVRLISPDPNGGPR